MELKKYKFYLFFVNCLKKLKKKIIRKLAVYSTIKFSKSVFDNSIFDKNKKLCIFFTSSTANPTHIRTELVFSKIMLKRGYRVIVVLSGSLYNSDEFLQPKEYNPKSVKIRKNQIKIADRLVSLSPKNIICLSSLELSQSEKDILYKFSKKFKFENIEDLINIELYGVKVHEHIYSTYCRQTLTAPLDLKAIDLKRYRIIATNVLKSIIYTNKVLKNLNPDITVAVHGIYTNHGPLVDLCRIKNKSLTIWGVPYRRKTYFMTKGDTYHRSLIGIERKLWDINLTKYEESKIISYLDAKETGNRDYWSYKGLEELKSSKKISEIAKSKKIYTLFTNVMWDAQIYYNTNLFDNQIDWIKFTVDVLSQREDIHTVIRIHPAEISQSNEALKDSISELLNSTYSEKITIIDPNDSFSSYELLRISAKALIFGSKISLEAAYREVPTIICGNSLFKQNEFSYLPNSRQEYKKLLIEELAPLKHQRLYSIRFAYYVYFRIFLDSKWAENLLDVGTSFYDLSEIDEDDIFNSILLGTA